MTLIRNHPEARWLPSRCHFALFRLFAYVRLVTSRAVEDIPTVYAIDSEQNAFENFAVSALFVIAPAAYVAAALGHAVPLFLAIAIGVVATPLIVHLPFFAIGLVVMPLWRRITGKPPGTNVPATSFGTMLLLFAASVWFVFRPGWPRFIAYAVLALFALNATAAVVVLALRRRIAEAEKRCVA